MLQLSVSHVYLLHSALPSRHRAADVFHGGENHAPVAPLQLLHERQIVADPESSDWLLLQEKTGTKKLEVYWIVLIKKIIISTLLGF